MSDTYFRLLQKLQESWGFSRRLSREGRSDSAGVRVVCNSAGIPARSSAKACIGDLSIASYCTSAAVSGASTTTYEKEGVLGNSVRAWNLRSIGAIDGAINGENTSFGVLGLAWRLDLQLIRLRVLHVRYYTLKSVNSVSGARNVSTHAG